MTAYTLFFINNYNFLCSYKEKLVIILNNFLKIRLKTAPFSSYSEKTVPLSYNVPWRKPGQFMHVQIIKVVGVQTGIQTSFCFATSLISRLSIVVNNHNRTIGGQLLTESEEGICWETLVGISQVSPGKRKFGIGCGWRGRNTARLTPFLAPRSRPGRPSENPKPHTGQSFLLFLCTKHDSCVSGELTIRPWWLRR